MNSDRALKVLRAANRLKLVPRTGWLLRGVQPAESVADHTYGVALTALLLADLIAELVDRERLLILALLHDLADVRHRRHSESSRSLLPLRRQRGG